MKGNMKITEEQQAQGQNQFLADLIEHIAQPMIIASADKRLCLWNKAFSKLIGYTGEELRDPIVSAGLSAPEWHEGETKALEKLRRTGQTQTFQKEYIRKDGSRIPVEVLVYQVTDDIGKVEYYVGLITDITERKQVEEALQKSDRHYRILVENAIEGIVVTQDEKIKFVNPIVSIVSGYSTEELQSMSLKDLVHPDDEKAVVESLNKAAVPGTLHTPPPFRIRTKGGDSRWIEAAIVSIIWDDKTANLNLLRDITKQKEVEETLIKSEDRYRTILEDMKEGYWEVDLAGNYTYFNDAISRLLGYPKKELAGMNYRIMTKAEDVEKVYRAFNKVYRTGKPITNMHYEVIQKDGSRGFAETSVFPRQNDEGEIIGFRGVSRDVTERMQIEETLKHSEQKHRTVLEQLEESYYEVDQAGNFTFFNDAICRQLGYSREELMGMNYKVYTPPEKAEEVFQAYNEVFRTGEPTKMFDMEQIRKDGTRITIENSIFPLRNEKGEITGFRGVGRDVTERKRILEALRQSEERYRTILEETKEAYYEMDIRGNFTFFNDALCTHLGYSREELMGMNYKVYVPPEKAGEAFEIYNRVYRTGKTAEMIDVIQIKKDKTRIFVESSASPIRNDSNEIIGFRGIMRDVTERKEAEENLRQSEERYRTILEEMKEAYFEVDIKGNYTFFNDALCRHLGYSREELMGLNYRAYVPPGKVKETFEIYNRIYRTGEPAELFNIEQIKKDGTTVFVECSASPIRNEKGDIIGFRGVLRDVTERKKAEEERRQLEQKAQLASRLASVGELASGVAHEINNPLTGVIGYAHLLLAREDIPKDMIRDVEIINEGAQRVSNIVKKLLAFARQTKPEQRYININELIRNTLDLQAYALAANNIKVSLQVERDLPMTIADPGQLQQVFLNLIMNAEEAIKSSRDKGKLVIKTEHTDNTIRISFKDNGPGIPEENLANIFNPFFTTREVGQGTGLGLSVCHGIVVEHKGRIWAESEPGKGATFTVELPTVTEGKQLERPEPVIVEEPKKVTKAKILVVDDEPVIHHLISQVLTEEGHLVETADNAADALELVKSKRYRLILLDIKMPGMSGVELYKQFQKIAPSLTKRVVFITGDVMGKRTIAFLNKTKAQCLMKPFDAKQLKAEIKRILSRR